jgi:hypothetical protein
VPSARRPIEVPVKRYERSLWQIEIGQRLSGLRKAAGKKPIDVFDAGILSVEEVLAYEAGRTAFDANAVAGLCELYGAGAAISEEIVGFVLDASTSRWMDLMMYSFLGFGI